ncbi:hypothetical protein QTP86_007366 [Hemibagrus guttatus]|nr:hypothetical protein QTP86_007366 [Hemibagrus guttatus]
MAAEALVAKHPCLKELGSKTGWNGWKNSIKFKMGNYRGKMRRAGCQEVTVNAGKRSRSNPECEPSDSNIKRPRSSRPISAFPKDETDEPEFGDVALALLTFISDNDRGSVHYQPMKISVIIESEIVVSLSRLADAFLFRSLLRHLIA